MANPTSAGEPVAWRYTWAGKGVADSRMYSVKQLPMHPDWKEEPLYTHPPAQLSDHNDISSSLVDQSAPSLSKSQMKRVGVLMDEPVKPEPSVPVKELERDAARYRWLVDHARIEDYQPFIAIRGGSYGVSAWTGEYADQKIDEAMLASRNAP